MRLRSGPFGNVRSNSETASHGHVRTTLNTISADRQSKP